ncbi:META domain-containing protein [Sphingosinicella sp. CPCC 101087]|uniref:META domain-containing protein n=1 Tax=Sphingosinicella sp. CPCC 101087 TaxID=2497754 RepID=UPI0013EE19F3|nr:META domain-containing protein [Sphingosinicella sp. CPCC 101087]
MKRAALLVALTLSACTTALPSDPPAAGPYRALGTEPFWAVTIAEGRMTWESPDGAPVSVAAPSPEPTPNGRRYVTDRLTLDIVRRECSDGMSDRRYADTVTARLDGRTFNGCGGEILPPGSLADTSWSIVAIDGAPVSGQAYHLSFTADRISGQAGCNRFSGAYSISDAALRPGPIAATRMACPEPAMQHEQRVLGLLSGPVSIQHPDGDTLVLSGAAGTIRLRRSI